MKSTENYIKHRDNPFECMSSEARYWIGYIFADGHLINSGRNYSISLFSKDREIMGRFKDFIGNSARMYVRPTGIIQVAYNSKPVTQWFMEKFSVPEKKALTLNPSIELDWDILHGYFDGDGCIRKSKSRGRWDRYEAKFTTGSRIWAERIKKFLEQEGIQSSIKEKGSAFDVNIYGKTNLFYLYKQMYASDTSKLEYKYKQFVALFGDK